MKDNCKRGLEWREPLLSYGHFSNKLRKKLIVTFKSVSIESLYKIPVNLRSAYLPPSAQQTRLAPFPSIIRLVSPSAAAAAATAIPKDEFPQVSGEQEQRTDAGDEQETSRKHKRASYANFPTRQHLFLPKRKVGCGGKVDTINEKSPQIVV